MRASALFFWSCPKGAVLIPVCVPAAFLYYPPTPLRPALPYFTGLSTSPPPAFLRVPPKVPLSRPSPAGGYASPDSKTLGGIPFVAGEGAGQ